MSYFSLRGCLPLGSLFAHLSPLFRNLLSIYFTCHVDLVYTIVDIVMMVDMLDRVDMVGKEDIVLIVDIVDMIVDTVD